MSCSYPLLGLPHGIEASLTYSSHTLNPRAGHGHTVPRQHRLALALDAPRDGQWLPRDKLPIEPHGDRVVVASSYGLAPGELMVAVPVANDAPLEASATLLPKPCGKRVDRSPVAERRGLGFHWPGISSSCQGEIPLRMAEMEGGSSLSFDPLRKPDPAVGCSLVALMTISRRHGPSPLPLERMDGGSRRLLATREHHRNSRTVVEVPEGGFSAAPLVMRGGGWVAIPIVVRLSRVGGPASKSVEHTHPPTELFWEEDRVPGSGQVKRSWLGMRVTRESAGPGPSWRGSAAPRAASTTVGACPTPASAVPPGGAPCRTCFFGGGMGLARGSSRRTSWHS